jgi:hypothetical protein
MGERDMKKKHREAMIAYGLKIAAHEELLRRHKICLDVHNVRFGDAKVAYNSCMTRLAVHDEEIEALSEDDPLEIGYRQDMFQRVKVLEGMMVPKEGQAARRFWQIPDQRFVILEQQIKTIEGILNNTPFSSVLMKELVNRVTALEGDRHTFLPHQHIGVEDRIKVLEENSIPVKYIKKECNTYHDEVKVIWEKHETRITAVEDAWRQSQKTEGKIIDIASRREVVVETLQQQIKEINSRLTALTNKYLELRPTQKKQPKTVLEWGMGTAPPAPDTPQVNLLAVKKSRPRKKKAALNAEKEYKRIMKHGASVG